MRTNHTVLVLLLVLQLACGLSLRSHDMATPSHQYYGGGGGLGWQIIDLFLVIGIVCVLVAVGVCCFCFRGAIGGGDSQPTRVEVVAPQGNQTGNRRPPPSNQVSYHEQV